MWGPAGGISSRAGTLGQQIQCCRKRSEYGWIGGSRPAWEWDAVCGKLGWIERGYHPPLNCPALRSPRSKANSLCRERYGSLQGWLGLVACDIHDMSDVELFMFKRSLKLRSQQDPTSLSHVPTARAFSALLKQNCAQVWSHGGLTDWEPERLCPTSAKPCCTSYGLWNKNQEREVRVTWWLHMILASNMHPEIAAIAMYSSMQTYTHTFYVCTYTQTHAYMNIHICTYTHIYLHTYMYPNAIYRYSNLHMYMYIYIYI